MYFQLLAAVACCLQSAVASPTRTATDVSSLTGPVESFEQVSRPRRRGLFLEPRDSNAVVTGAPAVTSINNNDGIGAGSNTYKAYSGDGSTGAGWPSKANWVSFVDMFNNNKPNMMISCGNIANQPNDSGPEIGAIYDGIQAIAQKSKVDHRFILAIIMQESEGCVRIQTTNNGISNPGLMQDYQGYYTCNDNTNIENDNYAIRNPCPSNYITQMIREGAVGTDTGPGLATDINKAGGTGAQAFYRAARLYNSGSLCSSDLSNACGATASYVSDIANRLTGWVH